MRLPDRPNAGSDINADVLAARLDAYAVSARDLNADGGDTGRARPADRGRHHALADRLARLPAAHPSAGLAAEREGADYGDQAGLRGESADLRFGRPDDSRDRHDDGGDPAYDLARGELAQGGDLSHDELGRDEPDGHDQWRDPGQDELGPGELGRDELGRDELGRDELGQGDSDAQRPTARHAGDTSAWAEPGGPMGPRSPYHPWFGADGVADPWFAADLDQ